MDWKKFRRSSEVEDRQGEFSPLAAMGIANPREVFGEIAEIAKKGAWTTPYKDVFPDKYGPLKEHDAGQLSVDAGKNDIKAKAFNSEPGPAFNNKGD